MTQKTLETRKYRFSKSLLFCVTRPDRREVPLSIDTVWSKCQCLYLEIYFEFQESCQSKLSKTIGELCYFLTLHVMLCCYAVICPLANWPYSLAKIEFKTVNHRRNTALMLTHPSVYFMWLWKCSFKTAQVSNNNMCVQTDITLFPSNQGFCFRMRIYRWWSEVWCCMPRNHVMASCSGWRDSYFFQLPGPIFMCLS